jgi:hypothetical protein
MLGGSVKVTSIKGSGTRIEVTVPIQQCERDYASGLQARTASVMAAVAANGHQERA